MQIIKAWLSGYFKPSEMINIIKEQDTPFLGFITTVIRGLLNSLLLFLPLHLMGRYPSMPSWLTFMKTENYFLFLVFVIPIFFILLWLVLSGSIYIILRLVIGKNVQIDHILNIFGVTSLIVGSFLVLWDWV